MDQSRSIVIAAAAVSLAASLFAIGAAISSDDDGGGSAVPAGPAESTAATESPAPTGAAETADAGGGADTTVATAGGPPVDVAIAGFAFNDDQPVTVAVGTEVVWTNEDSMEHTVEFAADSGIPTSPVLAQGDTYSFTFTEPGTYEYICGIHPTMNGTIVVEG